MYKTRVSITTTKTYWIVCKAHFRDILTLSIAQRCSALWALEIETTTSYASLNQIGFMTFLMRANITHAPSALLFLSRSLAITALQPLSRKNLTVFRLRRLLVNDVKL